MKKKLVLTMLCAIGLCLIFSCRMDYDTAAISAAAMLAARSLNADITESARQEFFRNQSKSLSILDEAMSPFKKESSMAARAGRRLFCESFAAVFILF